VRVRIVREPAGSVDGVTLRNYRIGATYDIPAALRAVLRGRGVCRCGDAPARSTCASASNVAGEVIQGL
jgi:hypothetical protein